MELIRNEFKKWFTEQTGMEAQFDGYNTAFVTKPPKTSGETICNTNCMGMWEAWQASRATESQRGLLLHADQVQLRIEITIQRDELLAALEHLHHNAKASGAEMGLALDVAEEAIAKAKGGAA